MNKEQKPSKSKKGASVGIAICFVAAVAIVGTYTLRDYQEAKRQELSVTEDTDSAEDTDGTKEEEHWFRIRCRIPALQGTVHA